MGPKKGVKITKDDKLDFLEGKHGKKYAKLRENIELAGGKIFSKDKYKRDVHKFLKDKVIQKVDKLADKPHFKDVKKKYVQQAEVPHVVTRCVDIPREVCNDVSEEQCESVPKEVCNDVTEEKCKLKPVKDCGLKEKESCIPYPKKKCE